MLNSLDVGMMCEISGGIRIKYIGGLIVMIVFLNHGDMMKLWNKLELWNKWFSRLDVWEDQVVHPSQLDTDDNDFSMVCVRILVGNGALINVSVTIKWKDKNFKIWLYEDNWRMGARMPGNGGVGARRFDRIKKVMKTMLR
ncbi:hypothetical protein Hanom_Chr02g00152151 [Helianthus anomalus]